MRELKFRAWDNVTLKMSPPFALFGGFTLLGAVHDWQHEMGHTAKTSLEALGSLEVMQFCGLHDKNGKEIFEGDLIRVEMCECTGHDDEGNEIWIDCEGPVSFEDGAFVFDGHSAGTIPVNAYIENITIIGNIYEKP